MTDLLLGIASSVLVGLPACIIWRLMPRAQGPAQTSRARDLGLRLASSIEWKSGRHTPKVLPVKDRDDDAVDDIQYALDLETLSRLTPEERAGVDLWVRQDHYDTHHDRYTRRGIYACCLLPTRPTE